MPQKKSEVIEAGEDHVALQRDERRSVLNKLIYVHEENHLKEII